MKMKVAVWDTYVTKKDGGIMHFDIIAPATERNEELIHEYGRSYLRSRAQEGQPLSAKECSFCHIETASPEMMADIEKQGYHIIEMQGCY